MLRLPSAPAEGRVPVGLPRPVVMVVFLQQWQGDQGPRAITTQLQILISSANAASTWPVSCVLYFTHSPGPCTG